MELHFDQELAKLKDSLLRLANLAEESVALALKALLERDHQLAGRVIADDSTLDRLEMEIDERGIELIALRQPMAKDLRFITMVMKIATELERVGDQAVTIAHRAIELAKEPPLKTLVDIPRMADLATAMIRDTLDAFVYGKVDLARTIIERDEVMDQLNRQLHRELTGFMVEDPQTITRALYLMGVSRKLERIADHATNIAEEIVYLYEGHDIRHQHPKPEPSEPAASDPS